MLKPLLFNRFFLTLAPLAVGIAIWNVYVAANNDGFLSGYVVDASGQPVAGAKVEIASKAVASSNAIGKAVTDDNGRFEFGPHRQYALIVTATDETHGTTPPQMVRLWFRSQNYTLDTPLVLGAGQ